MKKFLIYGLLGSLAAEFASCSEDRIGDSDVKSDKDQTQFIAV